jgi:hypothetical protein
MVTVPRPERLLILLTLISDAIWVHYPPLVFSYLSVWVVVFWYECM